jgi:hypothetical protein
VARIGLAAWAVTPLVALACGAGAERMAPATPATSAEASAVASSAAAPSSSAPIPLPSATARAQALAPDATAEVPWIKLLPTRPAHATIDSTVWAAIPTKTDVRIGVYRVLAVSGATASLLDVLRVRWDGVPGALLLPVLDPLRLKTGEVVTYADWRGYVGVAIVTRMLPKPRVRFRDGYGIVRDEDANVGEPLDGTVKPLAWVAFPKTADAPVLARGIVFAVDGDTLFVRDDDGHAFVVERSKVHTIPFPAKKLAVGDAIDAYTPEQGYKSGIVDRVFLPGLSYGVVVDGVSRTYFFSDLAVSAPATPPQGVEQGEPAGK